MRIINIEPTDFSNKAKSILQEICDYTECEISVGSNWKEVLKAYDGVITRLQFPFTREVLDDLSQLKLIGTATTGLNHIDTESAKKHGIEIVSLKGETEFLNTVTATSEHALFLMLALARNGYQAMTKTLEGHWDRNLFIGSELLGKKLGIIGFGRLGKKLADYGRCLGMEILVCDLKEQTISLKALLQESDFVSLHADYRPENQNMLGAGEFALMKPSAYFINTARGELVDEHALLEALKTKKIAGAAVDVIANEQERAKGWGENDPLFRYAKENQNLIITPHIGGATRDSMRKTEVFLAEKIAEFIKSNV